MKLVANLACLFLPVLATSAPSQKFGVDHPEFFPTMSLYERRFSFPNDICGGGVKFLHKSHIDPEKEERYEL